MGAVQLEAGRVVVEVGRLPGGDAVAVLAGVGEPAVARISRAVEVGLMAGETLARRAGVTRAVTRGAGGGAVGAVQLEAGLVVIEGRRLPGGDAVAVLAAVGEAAVARVAGAVEVALMAGEAVGGSASVTGPMAARALGRAVGAVQLEAGGVVIEERRLPGSEAVAFATSDRKAGMHRVAGAGEVDLVAGEALGGRPGVAGAVAGRALDRAMGAKQLEAGLVVIEGRRLPGRDAVAVLAAGGEAGVHGIARAGEVLLVTGEAVGGRRRVTVAMAGGALRRAVGAVELERRLVVIEGRRLPGGDAVAGLAGVGKAGVARTGGAAEGGLVTGEAVELALDRREVEGRVAGLAGGVGMRAAELEAGRGVFPGQRRLERRPAFHRMALRAFDLQGAVRIRRPRLSRRRGGSPQGEEEGQGRRQKQGKVHRARGPARRRLVRARHPRILSRRRSVAYKVANRSAVRNCQICEREMNGSAADSHSRPRGWHW